MSCESCKIEPDSRWIERWIEGRMEGRLTESGERYMERNLKLDDMIRIMKESYDFSARYIIFLFFSFFPFLALLSFTVSHALFFSPLLSSSP